MFNLETFFQSSSDQGHDLHTANHQSSSCQSKVPIDALNSSYNRNDNIRRSQQNQPSARCSQDQSQNHSVNITPAGYHLTKNYSSVGLGPKNEWSTNIPQNSTHAISNRAISTGIFLTYAI